jgi:hypothetical protein
MALSERHHEALLGVFDVPFEFLGGIDVRCPVCSQNTPPDWHAFETRMASGYESDLVAAKSKDRRNRVGLSWMRCGNEDCEQLIIQVHEQRVNFVGSAPIVQGESWVARPRFGETKREIPAEVDEPYRRDYQEAAALLEISPRMSAVLSRKILGDLLAEFAGLKMNSLKAQIDGFIEDQTRPYELRENLHYLREMGDFSAHTQRDEREDIIEVDRDEAEWTLDVIDGLFGYFIVSRRKSVRIRQGMAEKIKRAGRKEIPPLPDAPKEDD